MRIRIKAGLDPRREDGTTGEGAMQGALEERGVRIFTECHSEVHQPLHRSRAARRKHVGESNAGSIRLGSYGANYELQLPWRCVISGSYSNGAGLPPPHTRLCILFQASVSRRNARKGAALGITPRPSPHTRTSFRSLSHGDPLGRRAGCMHTVDSSGIVGSGHPYSSYWLLPHPAL